MGGPTATARLLLQLTIVLALLEMPAYAQVRALPGLSSLEANPAEVTGGGTFSLTVNVVQPTSPGSGFTITVRTGNLALTPFAPRTVRLPWLRTSTTLRGLPTRPVAEDTPVILSAVQGGTGQIIVTRTRTATLMVLAPRVASVTITPTPVVGGSATTGRVTLTGPAPATGLQVALSSGSPSVTRVPPTVVVPPGARSAEFAISTNGVRVNRSPRVLASYLDSTSFGVMQVLAPSLLSLSVVPGNTPGGASVLGLVAIDGPAPDGGLAVDLVSGRPDVATVPAEVMVPAGLATARFEIQTRPTPVETTATIGAALGNRQRSANLIVEPVALSSVTFTPSVLRGGRPLVGTVNLIGPAGPAGVEVRFANSDPNLSFVPDAVMVAAGELSGTFAVHTERVFTPEPVEVTGRIDDADPVIGVFTLLPAAKGDADGDGDIDLSDFLDARACYSGAGNMASLRCYSIFDWDGDLDVDLADYVRLQNAYTGAIEGLPLAHILVDETLRPSMDFLPPINGGNPRPVACVTDDSGIPAEFVANEVVLQTDDPAVMNAFLARWNGRVLTAYMPNESGIDGVPEYLVQIPTDDASMVGPLMASLAADLKILEPNGRGGLMFSSDTALALMAVAARANCEGQSVDINWIMQGSDIRGGSTTEASFGPDPDGSGPDSYSSDAFDWWTLVGQPTAIGPDQTELWPASQHGVVNAWQYLNRAGLDNARIRVAVIDGGFMGGDADMPADRIAISLLPGVNALNSQNPTGCGGGNLCPWHGTGVVQTLGALIDNSTGTAGTGGQIVRPITIHTTIDMASARIALGVARNRGARVVNMSFGARVPALATWSVSGWNDATVAAANAGLVLVTSAGNSGEDVDAEDCFIACWEEAWWAPCENDGVLCVGGLGWGSTYRHASSNYGNEEVDIFAPYRVYRGATPTNPNGNSIGIVGGTSFSSPYTAGVAAMILAADPSLSSAAVRSLLVTSGWTSYDYQVRRLVNAERAVRQALGDVPPDIKIIAPADGGSVGVFQTEFRAVATDREDDRDGVPLSVIWESNRDGVFGSGTLFHDTDLSVGQHTITATVTDSNGWRVSDQVTISRFNNAPQLEIIEPLDGQMFVEGEVIVFRGTSFDLDDFQSGGLTNGQVSWTAIRQTSFRSVPLGTGHQVVLPLTEGNYAIRFRGQDADGAVGTAPLVGIVVGPQPDDLPPIVTITNPPEDVLFRPRAGTSCVALTLIAIATDPEDGALAGASVVWRSNIDGVLGTGISISVSLCAARCGPQVYEITVTVTDSAGNVRSRLRRITIHGNPC